MVIDIVLKISVNVNVFKNLVYMYIYSEKNNHHTYQHSMVFTTLSNLMLFVDVNLFVFDMYQSVILQQIVQRAQSVSVGLTCENM